MVNARVKWTGEMQFLGEALTTGHSLLMDADQEFGGKNAGFRPMHLLLVALGGCTGMDVVSILKKKKQNIKTITMNIKGEQAVDNPHIFTGIDIEYVISGKDISEDAVERAIKLSEEKYCSVLATLKPLAKVNIRWKIDKSRL